MLSRPIQTQSQPSDDHNAPATMVGTAQSISKCCYTTMGKLWYMWNNSVLSNNHIQYDAAQAIAKEEINCTTIPTEIER